MMRKVSFIAIILLLVSGVASAELAGYWKFDEGSGLTAVDSSGNGKTGDFYAADGSNYPQWIAGYDGIGGALEFNALTTSSSNSNRLVVSLSGSDDLANLGEAFTISMWIKRDAVSTSMEWPSVVYTDAYDIELATDPCANSASIDSHDYFWNEISSSWEIDLGASTIEQRTLGQWYHLAISYDGNYIKKYINGTLITGDVAPTSYSLAVGTDLLLGARANNNYFEGALDDVAIWSDGYLSPAAIGKLANGSETPLTVSDLAPVDPLPSQYFASKEEDIAWLDGYGWATFWSESFSWDMTVASDNTADAWWMDSTLIPGSRSACWDMNKWFLKDIDSPSYAHPAKDIGRYGIEWIDPSWSGVEPNKPKFAAYITPGLAVCQNTHGFQLYRPDVYPWENKDYFKTYARVAALNADGAFMQVRSYSYEDGNSPFDANNLTYLGEVVWPLDLAEDYVWQEFKHAFPKPTDGLSSTRAWVEVGLIGGSEDTVLYIDEFSPISDQSVTFFDGDLDRDSLVYIKDFNTITESWLDTGPVTEPRDTGMLVNGDFYSGLSPWAFAGTGDSGLEMVGDAGLMNSYMLNTPAPIGGSVAAYIIDDAVVSQTTTGNVVSGQTYYVMAYVMTDSWDGWKDDAILSLEIGGVEVASFSRPMSLNRWRPVYGTYTATAGDAGKPITAEFSYANAEGDTSGYMFIGYCYLDTVMPDEWPEGRDNALTNGGFEDLSNLEGGPFNDVYESIRDSDNWGAWFVDDVPSPVSWIFEVPSGFDETDEGGIFASGQMGAPIPSPGMNDVSIYASEDLVLGQIIGGFSSGTKYYVDMACGVVIEPTEWGSYDVTWPSPAPQFHIELWRIPSGVTDPAAIHTGITTSQSGYVKIAEAVEDASGDIKGGSYDPPASKWQLVGTSYTATSADTNVYVRVYGTNSVASPHPSFAFSDVFVSTEKRLVPGGEITFEIESGLQYDVTGPYSCYHASLMGLEIPEADANGDCVVNFVDFAILAEAWLEPAYEHITDPDPD